MNQHVMGFRTLNPEPQPPKQACASVIKSHVFRCTSGVVVGDVGSQCSVTGTDLELCSQVHLWLGCRV